MFHLGKVLHLFKPGQKEIISSDSSVQATVLMWDENMLTIGVESSISEKIKENDIVLVDYNPLYSTIPVPKQVIVKIVRGELAKKIWKEYEDYHKQKKAEAEPPAAQNYNVR